MSLFGLLNLNKPSGLTSRQVVDRVKRVVKPAKVGHAGTLDPLASGVLVIGVGQGTRLVEYLHQLPKRYRATFLLGRTSDTEDTTGEVVELPDAQPPSREQLQRAAAELTGTIWQRPPAFSALKVEGRRAYALARAGEPVELVPRTIDVHRLEIVAYAYPELTVEIECSSGTYVRSLGRDLAERAGTAAVMSALQRTAIGPFTLDDALDPAELRRETVEQLLVPPLRAVEALMTPHVVSADQITRLCNGLPIDLPLPEDRPYAAIDQAGRLIAILASRGNGTFAAAKYFPDEA
jgi:tRNA pseudouridine55 synthase